MTDLFQKIAKNLYQGEDKLVAELVQEALDAEARKQFYAEISRIIAEDQPADFLSFPRSNSGFQANVEGIDPGMRMGWNYHEWYFAEP